MVGERVVIALGGNAIASEGHADPRSQQRAVEGAAVQIATLVATGHEVVITHGNGPQVGNLLLKNELARDVVPPVPLDWCVAQTQATLGFLIVTALEAALERLGVGRAVATVVTRVLVSPQDPAWEHPTKPIGQHGWRHVVPSPEPLEILDRHAIERLVADGVVVVAAGGGGIPMVRRDGRLRGVEAVLDKDLTGAMLASTIGAGCLLIATDVQAAATDFGTSQERWIGEVSPTHLRALIDEGHFAAGSMAPKVEAAVRFVEQGGRRAVITSLGCLGEGIDGAGGTVVTDERRQS